MSGEPRPLQGPSGYPPPTSAVLPDGKSLALMPLARGVCARYRREFPDEENRYGDAGMAWCVHDNLHLLNWAVLSLTGEADFTREVTWLARVLEAREFPLDRLARNLDICADVVSRRLRTANVPQLARVLRDAAEFVRAHESFLD